MTNLIPDWELPNHLAGNLIDMDRFRGRERATLPDDSWEPGQKARVHEVDFAGTHQMRAEQKSPGLHPQTRTPGWEDLTHPEGDAWGDAVRNLNAIEPYDPEKHGTYEPAEMYSQDSLDALEKAGFEPHEAGVWHRPVTTDEGEELGARHILVYDPGHRRPTDNSRAPWHLMTDPESVGVAFRTLRGHNGALAAADEDRAQIRRIPKQARRHLFIVESAGQSPGRANADDWLARNTPESFENEDWMREREGDPDQGYTHWEPEHETANGVDNYSDFRDPAGMTFDDHEDEGRAHVMPGSAYDFNSPDDDWRSISNGPGEDSAEPLPHEQDLADLGFNWRRRGDPNTTPAGEHLEGEYVRDQHTPEGQHMATHTIRRVPYSNTWHVESTGPSDSNFAYESSDHQFPHDAISRYHDNAERALLPARGYEPHRGRSGAITHWTRTDTGPTGDTYEHEISNQPVNGEGNDQGWLGHTVSENMIAPSHGTRPLHRYDLADVVREQDRTGRGLHPGGAQDYRLTRGELLGDPSVSSLLGNPGYVSDNFFGDGKVGSAHWSIPHPTDIERPINAEATYNWDKGGYDFKYTHDGLPIHPASPHFPAGAPVHVPGRQTRIPLEGAS